MDLNVAEYKSHIENKINTDLQVEPFDVLMIKGVI